METIKVNLGYDKKISSKKSKSYDSKIKKWKNVMYKMIAVT